jgi:hypothetical protein
MKTVVQEVEVKNEFDEVQAERLASIEAINEISSIELAYVGGGIATVSFV